MTASAPEVADTTGGSLRRVAGFVRALIGKSRSGTLAAAGLLVPLGFVVEGAGLLLLIPILGLVLDAQAAARWPIVETIFGLAGAATPAGRIGALLGLFGGLMLVRAAILHGRDRALASLQTGFVARLRMDALGIVTRAPWHRLAQLRHGRVVSLLSSDLAACGAAAHFAIQSLVAAFLLAGYGALMLIVSPPLAAAALGLLALLALALLPLVRHALATGSAMSRANLAMADALIQFLGGLKLAKSLGETERFLDRLGADQDALSAAQRAYLVRQSRARVILTTAFALAGAGLVFAALFALGVAPPELIAQLLIVSRLGGPALQLQQGLHTLTGSVPAYERIVALQAELAPAADAGPARPAAAPIPARPEIVLAGVGFSHLGEGGAAERPILSGISLTLAPGAMVGLSGPSGAGKSTLADLLSGLLVASEGRIALDATTLDAGNAAAWAQRVSYVPQEAFLLNDSIAANLRWGAPGAVEAVLWTALEAVGAAELVRARGGLEAPAGERGGLLSGGERQRIGLARALLRPAELMILDEATNALDGPSEARLLDAIAGLAPRPTLVLISHSAAVLDRCERVLLLDRGRLIGER